MPDLTRLLEAAHRGDRRATAELLPLVYDELRKLAAARLAEEKTGDTLQATALVHEAYLRLVGPAEGQGWENRGHFFAAAAEAMRRILVERARRKAGPVRGGHLTRRELDREQPVPTDRRAERLLALDAALDRLAAVETRAAEVVKLRYFAGLTVPEVAEALGISPRTADADWAYARAWLVAAVRDGD
jgi:RNA polymerase sigma factor (TIGR02999 family)